MIDRFTHLGDMYWSLDVPIFEMKRNKKQTTRYLSSKVFGGVVGNRFPLECTNIHESTQTITHDIGIAEALTADDCEEEATAEEAPGSTVFTSCSGSNRCFGGCEGTSVFVDVDEGPPEPSVFGEGNTLGKLWISTPAIRLEFTCLVFCQC
eukprot:m.71272 g.71272  ORF g.71272 m.71272 type:complete len:151 (+) comp16081_c0_seq12:1435-1887(+)